MKRCLLSDALLKLLPGGVITRRREQDWRSATFAGVRLVLDLRLEGSEVALVQTFADRLADHDFDLPDLLVADIFVTDQRTVPEGIALTVEALLLDDEA